MPISLTGFVKAYDGPAADPNSPAGQVALVALAASLHMHAVQAAKK
jgi:hypothetical protein